MDNHSNPSIPKYEIVQDKLSFSELEKTLFKNPEPVYYKTKQSHKSDTGKMSKISKKSPNSSLSSPRTLKSMSPVSPKLSSIAQRPTFRVLDRISSVVSGTGVQLFKSNPSSNLMLNSSVLTNYEESLSRKSKLCCQNYLNHREKA